jgi:hypothetical protein
MMGSSSLEEWLRHKADALPGRRAALPPGTLAGSPPDPQGDEHRDPPPAKVSGSGRYRRTVDLMQDAISPTGNRLR